ncbi:MAG: ATP-binding cassette domain-containing protein [Flavobacteriaceae bacterium]|nr:ATP-binding cassette domain-containing protein [Flavobacteriaceae bacterium]
MKEAIILFKNATINQYKKAVLSDLSFGILQGSFVYLIGRTGSGKSSLLKTLYGDLKLQQGEGSIAGFDLAKLKDRKIPDLRRKIGVVFQDFQLLPDRSIERNLDFVLRATGWKNTQERNDKIDAVLDLVGLKDRRKQFPNALSGGEQQRIAIARALLNDPEIILADEPTGNLDPITSLEVMELLRNINQKGTTILMATHDYNLISKYPNTTYKCEEGKLSEIKKNS